MARRDWLITIRRELDLTQEQAADRAGIERSTYTKAENGCSIGVKTAKKIGAAFNFSWTLFFENNCDVTEQNDSVTSA